MKEILEVIVLNLVENKDQVEITETQEDKTLIFEVKVAQNDMGRIIGRQGKIAQSIRAIMKAAAAKENLKVVVEFVG